VYTIGRPPEVRPGRGKKGKLGGKKGVETCRKKGRAQQKKGKGGVRVEQLGRRHRSHQGEKGNVFRERRRKLSFWGKRTISFFRKKSTPGKVLFTRQEWTVPLVGKKKKRCDEKEEKKGKNADVETQGSKGGKKIVPRSAERRPGFLPSFKKKKRLSSRRGGREPDYYRAEEKEKNKLEEKGSP